MGAAAPRLGHADGSQCLGAKGVSLWWVLHSKRRTPRDEVTRMTSNLATPSGQNTLNSVTMKVSG